MKTKTATLIVSLSSMALSTAFVSADVIRLNDGTTIEGELRAPVEIAVQTPAGEKKIAFALLPEELQKRYWARAVEQEPVTPGPVTDEELAALANDVNLETWAQVAAIGSFRDRAEKRGAGGLVTSKAFNALEETWVTVYSPKDPVGEARNWDEPVSRAKQILARNPQFLQRRWLEGFVKAGEAVARRDSTEFAVLVRELKRSRVASDRPVQNNYSKATGSGLSTRNSDL
jgi:hypothetical protein